MKNKIKKEKANFQNVYIITTYRCNWDCPFCLFKYNKEKETSISEIIDKLKYVVKDSPQKVYIKITGGEPFLKPKLLKAIFEECEGNSKIYKIGIGSNGSIKFPKWFKDFSTRTHVFLSRHGISNLPYPNELYDYSNEKIDIRFNCNLIKNGIDNVDKIIEYIKYYKKYGISCFCFRELNSISLDQTSLYHQYIYDYVGYYKKNVILINNILPVLPQDFVRSRCTGNFYDNNIWYWYKKNISIKFRQINESLLLEYNRIYPDIIDEYIIHPDGTLTGCWDKELKIIKKGGKYAKQTLYSKTCKRS